MEKRITRYSIFIFPQFFCLENNACHPKLIGNQLIHSRTKYEILVNYFKSGDNFKLYPTIFKFLESKRWVSN